MGAEFSNHVNLSVKLRTLIEDSLTYKFRNKRLLENIEEIKKVLNELALWYLNEFEDTKKHDLYIRLIDTINKSLANEKMTRKYIVEIIKNIDEVSRLILVSK
jgi:predicted RNA-binding protein with EMAP domain